MHELMTIAEIESRFDAEWVLVGDPQTNEAFKVQSGTVLYHNKDRDEFDRKVLEFETKRFAVLYTGKASEDMEYVL